MLKTVGKKFLSIILALAVILGGLYVAPSFDAEAAIDVGANPKPPVDIAVNVPSDYPGTFLDFKQELTQKLIAQGMPADSFRITNTAVSIDTTNLDGWYVYDHYGSQANYDALKLSTEQQAKQPFRQADNSYAGGTQKLSQVHQNIKNSQYGCQNFDQHIYSYSADGKASMVFAGYGTQALMDYMIYPAASDSRRTVSFDVDANAIGAHTLSNYGFFINAGIDSAGYVNGYMLYISNQHTGNIQKVRRLATANSSGENGYSANAYGTMVANSNFNLALPGTKKVRLTVDIQKDKVTIQKQDYDASGKLGDVKNAVL